LIVSVTIGSANSGALEGERMAKRRFQNPKLQRRGDWWTIRVWQDEYENGKTRRSYKRIRLAPATMREREAQKVAAEYMQPLNQGLGGVLSATNFQRYIEQTYIPLEMPLLATSAQDRYQGVIDNYLIPALGANCLRELTPITLQGYLSSLATADATKKLAHASRAKIRTVLGAILRTAAIKYHLLVVNPMEGLSIPPDKKGKRRSKPFLTPEQFDNLLARMPEPYASMVYVAIYTGLRVSELTGLRWEDVGENTITVDERYCRGDWGAPKSESSNATIPVNRSVVERIHRMKLLTVNVAGGGPGNKAIRKYKIVKSCEPGDLVFQSVRDGKPMRDNNILCRFIKPAARAMGLPWVNWRSLRTSHAVWLKMAGADVKDAQGQMRHSRASTTLDIYQQFVPESQRRVVDRLTTLRVQ
jgi:integrase